MWSNSGMWQMLGTIYSKWRSLRVIQDGSYLMKCKPCKYIGARHEMIYEMDHI